MIARLIATLRRVCQRSSTVNDQPALEQTRLRQRAIVARAEALGVKVDVQTRRHRYARER